MADIAEAHRAEVLAYMRWAQARRQLRLRGVTCCFGAVREGRLQEDSMYTAEEVAELLDGLQGAVVSELELELLHSSHTNVLLLQQLLQQAEHWHLRLHADLSELENRRLLEEVAELERNPDSTPATTKPRLTPLDGPSQLLTAEISRLQEDNDKLRGRLRTLEAHITSTLDEKRSAETALRDLRQQEAPPPQNVSHLEESLASLKVELQKTVGEHSTNQKQLEENLTGTKHQLLRVQHQLTMAEKELEKKFQETTAYRNMKDMLTKKNEQIKDLRKRLNNYEPQD
ncbi:leucine zipper transcription factor-like protein 1 [Hyperolius riggenbachi]|uniref:leucine zipper transcription factor-like protein 1 n=1 Tax=Hyperolius riggenbachi TaxID=752182 RepID=UPI0035A26863